MVQGGKNRMFPINNILFCPLCKKRSERWISSGCAFQIKGHENYTYYKESCTKCQKHFYLPCGSNGIIEMRMNGVPIEDAIEAKCNEIKIRRGGLFTPRDRDRIEKQCKEIYEMNENDLVISEDLVKKEDLKVVPAWMS